MPLSDLIALQSGQLAAEQAKLAETRAEIARYERHLAELSSASQSALEMQIGRMPSVAASAWAELLQQRRRDTTMALSLSKAEELQREAATKTAFGRTEALKTLAKADANAEKIARRKRDRMMTERLVWLARLSG
jgi:hypothetical protein